MSNTLTGTGKLVCVTGASGFIALWIVKYLLQRGYTVNATVRNPNNLSEVTHLTNLDGAKERLRIFGADLLEQGSFDSAIDGCDGVFHTASPCFFDVNDPQAELIDPAVKGTINVLSSCVKALSVKRVVFTSSIAAVMYNGKPRNPEVVVDETWFSEPDICREAKLWYQLSKTLAEEAAWKFAKEKGIDMVVINPSMVVGPLLQSKLNTSTALILDLISGMEKFPNSTFGFVNVKDVANAHILAFEVPSARGRYCLSKRVCHFSNVVSILRELYPTLRLPEKCVDENHIPIFQIANEKAKSLGLEFTPVEISLKETVESLKEKQFVSF